MSLYVIHMRFTRRKILLAAAALVLVTGMALLLAGCFRSAAPREAVTLATNEQRVAYLESLGWQVLPEPVASRVPLLRRPMEWSKPAAMALTLPQSATLH